MMQNKKKSELGTTANIRQDLLMAEALRQPLPPHKLGEPPWSEEELKKSYFRNWGYTKEVIKKHPGYKAHKSVDDVNLAWEIFNNSVEDLVLSIDIFRKESKSSVFWTRPMRKRVNKLELAVRRGVFSSATAAIALVKCYRDINKAIPIDGYKRKADDEITNSEEHLVVEHLRDHIAHVRMADVGYRMSWSHTAKNSCRFMIPQKDIKSWTKRNDTKLWTEYTKSLSEDIDVEAIFMSYKCKLDELVQWLKAQIETASIPHLMEYRKYDRMLNRFGVRAEWNIILTETLKKNVDPYDYLERYLNKQERDEVMMLPMRSPKQIDKIIEILDEFDACDEDLRQKIYTLFKCNNNADRF